MFLQAKLLHNVFLYQILPILNLSFLEIISTFSYCGMEKIVHDLNLVSVPSKQFFFYCKSQSQVHNQLAEKIS